MKYAVIKFFNRQYKISEKETLLVDKLGSVNVKPDVLLFVDDEKVEVGKPHLEKVKVDLKVIEDSVKGDKIHVFKYKAKSRYRKSIGFRPLYSKLSVEKISSR
ncbi:MAG TPA: 50S ribosomal protein L21 [Candidatus Humimicrobiaceae bacterium]|nr:50S ribosomal protein L21 [Candidatus Humimicrobiaceae bacterium]